VKTRNTVILFAGLLFVLVLVGGSRRRADNSETETSLDVSIADLDLLEEQISGMEFEDLEGIDVNTTISFTTMDLDNLEEALEGLSFEDLEGLTEN
jgi:hypothetical protein